MKKESRTGSAAYCRELAECLRYNAYASDGIFVGPTDAEICEKALQSFAGRGLRRVQAVAAACLISVFAVLAARDGNLNGRADFFDYVSAAGEISGFGGAYDASLFKPLLNLGVSQ